MNNNLLKAQEVSDILNIGLSTVYAFVGSGHLKAIHLPNTRESRATKLNRSAIRFRLEDVEEFIHAHAREQVRVGEE